MALSLYRVLVVTLYFSEKFSEVAARGLAVAEALWPLKVTLVCFLEQESNLQSSILQQKHRLFLRCFFHLLLVNLLLLASLKERSTCEKLGCFLRVGNKDNFGKKILVDDTTRDEFALFWEAIAGLKIEAFPYF